MSGERDGAVTTPPHDGNQHPWLNRRRFVQSAAAASVVGALAAVGSRAASAPEATTGTTADAEPFPPAKPLSVATLTVLTTDSELRRYDSRVVRDRASFQFERLGDWQEAELAGGKPEHRFRVRARHTGWLTEVEVAFELHEERARTFVLRTRGDLKANRLWISKDYLHHDLGRAAFPELGTPDLFADHLWLATFGERAGVPAAVSQPSYSYRKPTGLMGLSLHGGYKYALQWRTQRDGRARDYQSAWFRDDQLIAELTESVFPTTGPTPVLPLPISVYLDTPEMSCCTAKADEWGCCVPT